MFKDYNHCDSGSLQLIGQGASQKLNITGRFYLENTVYFILLKVKGKIITVSNFINNCFSQQKGTKNCWITFWLLSCAQEHINRGPFLMIQPSPCIAYHPVVQNDKRTIIYLAQYVSAAHKFPQWYNKQNNCLEDFEM